MVFFNYATMQMAAKIVFYGPGLCGKTTNLQHIYNKTSPHSRGEMVSLETETDRTLFFDLLPIDVGVIGGFKTRLQLYTVPGQVFYNTTRKLVLKGADGIVFVADSQAPMLEANVQSLRNLKANLEELGLDLDRMPMVIQLNKRDLPNVLERQSMVDALDPEHRFEITEASAIKGEGVFETLKLISKLTLRALKEKMSGHEEPLAKASRLNIRDSGRSGHVPAPVPPPAPTVDPRKTMSAPIPPSEASEAAVSSSQSLAAVEVMEAEPPPEELRHEQEPVHTEPTPEPEHAPEAAEPVKRMKVRSSVDIMAELESLRRKATEGLGRPGTSATRRRESRQSFEGSVPPDATSRLASVEVSWVAKDADGNPIESATKNFEVSPDEASRVIVNLDIKLD
ncbi:MAG: GTPase domain-containing protein [Acidobacteria bacterium]|nr:GTPase domain-containing protein [Acidobacteriota bacterium]